MADILDNILSNRYLDEKSQIIEDLLKIELPKLTQYEKDTFVSIIKNINDNDIDSEKFLELGKLYFETIQIMREYNNGKISSDEAIRRMNET
jgi:hypothetical protein